MNVFCGLFLNTYTIIYTLFGVFNFLFHKIDCCNTFFSIHFLILLSYSEITIYKFSFDLTKFLQTLIDINSYVIFSQTTEYLSFFFIYFQFLCI